ncbi:MAG: hypothetical protein CMR00_01445 [[Chlorobium] sp. 445]|nr:MAG: hypothetical protein CMR00_01445 [[Chlorobium] sp. 445]
MIGHFSASGSQWDAMRSLPCLLLSSSMACICSTLFSRINSSTTMSRATATPHSSFFTSSRLFYAGQEGSFMLWMFYGALLGLFVIRTAKDYEAPVMTVLTLSQVFLLSMIMGIQVPGIGVIGSDPFALVLGEPPQEGDGLNALLQNPWMVIHPPTLFLGFSSLIVPFSFAIAALWKNKYDDWVRPALPWILFSAMTLGTGIMMGGYWAYKSSRLGGLLGLGPCRKFLACTLADDCGPAAYHPRAKKTRLSQTL